MNIVAVSNCQIRYAKLPAGVTQNEIINHYINDDWHTLPEIPDFNENDIPPPHNWLTVNTLDAYITNIPNYENDPSTGLWIKSVCKKCNHEMVTYQSGD